MDSNDSMKCMEIITEVLFCLFSDNKFVQKLQNVSNVKGIPLSPTFQKHLQNIAIIIFLFFNFFFSDKISCMIPHEAHMSDQFVHSACWIRGNVSCFVLSFVSRSFSAPFRVLFSLFPDPFRVDFRSFSDFFGN